MKLVLPLALLLSVLLWALAAPSGVPGRIAPDALSLDELLMLYGHMPRGAMALVAGACLGLSGALLQVVLRNPIADPSTLGISSGAQLALVAVTVLSPGLLGWGRAPVALAGAFAAAATFRFPHRSPATASSSSPTPMGAWRRSTPSSWIPRAMFH